MAVVSVFRLGVCIAALAWSVSVAAQDAGTVRIGQETKRTLGTITAMNAGDVACYLTLKDDAGGRFEEMARFEICEQRALLNKRVTLTYVQQKVMSPDCQGDPACKKTRTVALVGAVKPLAGAAPSAAAPTSFCTAAEHVVFSCRTGAKMVSVCASPDAGPGRGYLQYRFGKPDAADTLELTLPETKVVPAKAANGGSESYSGGGGAWLRFSKGGLAYTVYSGIGNWGPKGEKRIKEGLLVERAGKQVANLVCNGKLTSQLGPDWFEKVGVTRGNQEFFFPD